MKRSSIFLINGILFTCLGLAYTVLYGSGLVEWWRITRLPHDKIKDTPFEAIWTSGRGALGVFFLFGGILWLLAAWRNSGDHNSKASNPD